METTQLAIDYEAAERARAVGMRVVDEAASLSLRDTLDATIKQVADELGEFISADVIRKLGAVYGTIPNGKVIGPALKRVQGQGYIWPTGERRPSGRKENHNFPSMVWRKVGPRS